MRSVLFAQVAHACSFHGSFDLVWIHVRAAAVMTASPNVAHKEEAVYPILMLESSSMCMHAYIQCIHPYVAGYGRYRCSF